MFVAACGSTGAKDSPDGTQRSSTSVTTGQGPTGTGNGTGGTGGGPAGGGGGSVTTTAGNPATSMPASGG